MADFEDSTFARDLRTIFLDRDGVLNEKLPEGSYVTAWSDFHILPGVPEAIAALNHAGIRVIVVSNQRGIALGLYSAEDVEAIHAGFEQRLQAHGAHVDAFYFCPHDRSGCNCRKPLPGMFEQAQRDFPDISAASSVMIGDSLSDVQFGLGLGMLTIFIESASDRVKAGAEKAAELAYLRFPSLVQAVEALLGAR